MFKWLAHTHLATDGTRMQIRLCTSTSEPFPYTTIEALPILSRSYSLKKPGNFFVKETW